jgi:hypothetical protein
LWSSIAQLEQEMLESAASTMLRSGVDARTVDLVVAIQRGELRVADLSPADVDQVERHEWQDFAPAPVLRQLDALTAASRRYPEDDHALRPTRLGNTLRSVEDPLEGRIGRPIETWVQDVFHTLPLSVQDEHDHLRGRLDLYCSLVAVFAFEGLLAIGLLGPLGLVPAIGSAALASTLSWLSYRAAVPSGQGYGSVLVSIADISENTGPATHRPLVQRVLRSSFIRRFG